MIRQMNRTASKFSKNSSCLTHGLQILYDSLKPWFIFMKSSPIFSFLLLVNLGLILDGIVSFAISERVLNKPL